jgi:hypothetical protein
MIPVGILTAAATTSFVGLLDLYPSAAAAYSLRKLRAAYTGSAIRVRRSSDNATTNIGFVANVLDTTTLLTFCGAGSGFITIWYDQSGNGNNGTQNINDDQFKIVNLGVLITKNSKASCQINTTDYLTLTSVINGTAATLIEVTSVAMDPPSFDNGSLIGYISSAALSGHQPWQDGTIYEAFATTLRKDTSNPTTNLSNTYLYNVISDFNLYNIKINNSTFFNTNTNIVNFGTSIPKIGKSNSPSIREYQYQGNASEIIIYTSNQSANISGINANINSYYTIY